MKVESVRIGGWFQRTILHLAEIRDFIQSGTTKLNLDSETLTDYRLGIQATNVHYHEGSLDYLRFESGKIQIKIYEDGLIVLSLNGEGVLVTQQELTEYYEQKLSPALNYLFSKGAQMPKELAGIAAIYPYFITVSNASKQDVATIFKNYNEEVISDYERDGLELYRSNTVNVIRIGPTDRSPEMIEEFIEQQIFARDFENQLQHYLNLHRTVWDMVAEVKERGTIKGREVKTLKEKIEIYAKTINLIDTRLNQMDTYLVTRESVVRRHQGDSELYLVLHYKYESMRNTLSYVQDLWVMTENYMESAQSLFKDLQDKATESSLKNLTVITTLGVFVTLSKVLSEESFNFTGYGFVLLIVYVMIGFVASKALKYFSASRKYNIKDTKVGISNVS